MEPIGSVRASLLSLSLFFFSLVSPSLLSRAEVKNEAGTLFLSLRLLASRRAEPKGDAVLRSRRAEPKTLSWSSEPARSSYTASRSAAASRSTRLPCSSGTSWRSWPIAIARGSCTGTSSRRTSSWSASHCPRRSNSRTLASPRTSSLVQLVSDQFYARCTLSMLVFGS